MQKIITNKIKCNFCNDIIESKNAHDYKVCQCGKCACYGGLKNLNRDFVYSHEDYTELSITEEIDEGEVIDYDEQESDSKRYNKRNKRRKGK